jgi:hypothetical protein
LLDKPNAWVYILAMPTLIKESGFEVRIYTRDEHPPAHVHVWKAEGEAVIYLGDDETPPSLCEVNRMRKKDVRKALNIVEDNQEILRAEWRRYHG